MLTFLFWNLNEKPLQSIINNLVLMYRVDVLMLAECAISETDLLAELNPSALAAGAAPFAPPDKRSVCERIVVYHRSSPNSMTIEDEDSFYSGRRVQVSDREEFLLFVVHLPSKLYRSGESQTLALASLSQKIRKTETKFGHQRTLLVGDLNVNPFEAGVVGAEGLNAVMTREIAQRGERTIDRLKHPFFYNPMWGLFGDAQHEQHPPGNPKHSPTGTCYYPAGESVWYYWNMFDQVFLRPELVPFFKHRDLKLLVTDGVTSFLNDRGIPDRIRLSDHLPLLFRLRL